MEHPAHIRRSFRPMPWLAAALVSGLVGSVFIFQSFAATASYSDHYPYGFADSCALINNQTFIYGWANDPEAGTGLSPYVQVIAGNNSQRVATNISGYRDAAINTYITKHFPNQPHYKEYGFQAVFSGLYKGTIYSISGTVYNVGAGSDHKLYIQSSGSVDGSSKPYFAHNVIPDACLANKPAPPPPPPSPNPQPSPSPSPPPSHSGGSSGSSGNTQPAGPVSDADATITAGTTSATISVPAHNAAKIHISYLPTGGISTDTPDQNVSNDKVVIDLHDLKPKTNYSFTITRTNSNGASANSNAQNFTTPGFNISMSFVDKNNKPVKGIVATLNDANNTQVTSDKNGKVTFHNLDIGDYNVSFNYGGQQHVEQFSTDTASANSNANGQVITLNDVVNVDDLVGGGSGTTQLSKGSSFNPLIIVVLVVLVAAGGGIWWFIRRRASNQYGLAPAPAPQADIIDQASMKEFAKKQPPAGPPPEHMGQSLRDMVLQSMHEEAEKRKQQPPQEPPNPPQP